MIHVTSLLMKYPIRIKITTIKIIIIIISITVFNSNTGPSHTKKKLQEIHFEATRHRRAMQKM